MRGIYKIVDTVIRIDSLHPDVHELCRNWRSEGEPELFITTTQADIDFEREKSDREALYEGLVPQYFEDGYLETLAVYRKLAVLMLDRDVLLFHGCVVAVGDEAYLFTAKSGTGKTTHVNLWLKNIPGAYIVNGDKPMLLLTEDGVIAYGTPWQGKEQYGCNTAVPLKAVCILERAADNHIERVTMGQVLTLLIQQAYRPKEAEKLRKTLSLVGQLGSRTALYRLGCNMQDEAALVAYEGMK